MVARRRLARLFNGVDSYLDMGVLPVLNDFTFSIWVRTTETAAVTIAIGGARDTGFLTNIQWVLNFPTAGQMNWAVRSDTAGAFEDVGDILTPTVDFSSGRWVHHVGIRKGASIEYYLDGVPQAITLDTDLLDTAPLTFTQAFTLGVGNQAELWFSETQQADFAIYPKALNATQVKALASRKPPQQVSALLRYWPLNGNDDELIVGARATPVNDPQWTDGPTLEGKPRFAFADIPDDVRFLPVPRVWTKQPAFNAVLKPKLRGLVECYLLTGATARAALNNSKAGFARSIGPSIVTRDRFGLGSRFSSGSDTTLSVGTGNWDKVLNISGRGTVIIGLTVIAQAAFDYILDSDIDLSGITIQTDPGSGGNLFYTINSTTGHDVAVASMLPVVGEQTTLAISADGTNTLTYRNGVLRNTDTDSVGFNFGENNSGLTFGGRSLDVAARRADVDIYFVLFCDVNLSASEIVDVHNNVYDAIFEPPRIFVPVPEALPDVAILERSW